MSSLDSILHNSNWPFVGMDMDPSGSGSTTLHSAVMVSLVLYGTSVSRTHTVPFNSLNPLSGFTHHVSSVVDPDPVGSGIFGRILKKIFTDPDPGTPDQKYKFESKLLWKVDKIQNFSTKWIWKCQNELKNATLYAYKTGIQRENLCYYTFFKIMQDPDPKWSEKLDPDPKKIIPDPQHCRCP